MTSLRYAAVVAIVLAACSSDGSAPATGEGRADEAADQAFDQLVAIVGAEGAIANADTQGFAESQVTVHEETAGVEPAVGKLLLALITKHAKDDEFGSINLGEALAVNQTILRSGDGACGQAKETLNEWLTETGTARDDVAAIFDSGELNLTFCAQFMLAGVNQGAELLLIQDRLIKRALVVEVTGRN